jgi:hypothetical protein
MEYFCGICLANKDERHFQTWLDDKKKARRCDSCCDSHEIRARVKQSKKSIELPKNVRKILADSSNKSSQAIRARIDAFNDERNLKNDLDL